MNNSNTFTFYLKKNYNLKNLDDYYTYIGLAIIASIIIYISFYFSFLTGFFIILILIIFLSFFINKYYEVKYQKQMELIKDKSENIKKQINDIILNTSNTQNTNKNN